MSSTSSKHVAILGCGWLGLPLAEQLIGKGYKINGSTTTPGKLEVLRASGIEPYLIQVEAEEITGDLTSFLSGVEVLIIDFPPGIRSRSPEDYLKSIEQLVKMIRSFSLTKVVFVSSISVYEDTEEFPVYKEEDMPNATSSRGKALIAAEELLRSEKGFSTTILRLGGLIGKDRHPVNQLSGRKDIANPEAPVNLISLTDCIGILEALLEKGSWGEVYNAVFPEHPSKESYYSRKARERSLPLPEFGNEPSKGKIIDSGKLQLGLDYEFKGRL